MAKDGNCVLFYKSQGTLSGEYPELKIEDFVLVIMTPAQKELLKKYGSDCLCIDGTHGLNSYDFELFTILVLDDLREGFPCAFLISNRGDHKVFELFFTKIKEESGVIEPKVFMSDLAEGFYNAWIQTMSIPEKRLFCTWHIDQAWRRNLSKIKNKEQQVLIYKYLKTLLEERDVDAFNKMVEQFCNLTDSDVIDFIKYFKDNYLKNIQQWAYCYRLYAGINTNMSMERMHRTIKYFYLKGKKVKRLDKSIAAIMKFVRDKLIDRLIAINKGKISGKIQNIRSRHKNMEVLKDKLDISLIFQTEHCWEVPSLTHHEIYNVQEINLQCTCRLICPDCNICLHKYTCTCVDASIKYNMCRHIHLVANLRSDSEKGKVGKEASHVTTSDHAQNRDDNNLYIHCEKADTIEAQAILSQLSRRTQNDLSKRKEKVKEKIMTLLETVDSIQSPTKLDIIQKNLASISPVLTAAENSKDINFQSASSSKIVPHNAKIIPQRRLFSTKKHKKTQKLVERPNPNESVKMSISLLNPDTHNNI